MKIAHYLVIINVPAGMVEIPLLQAEAFGRCVRVASAGLIGFSGYIFNRLQVDLRPTKMHVENVMHDFDGLFEPHALQARVVKKWINVG